MGNCTKQIVHSILYPEKEVYDPFLRAGHDLQRTVIDFLLDKGIEIPTASLKDEMEGIFYHRGKVPWKLVGHVDGILDAPRGILEVKAIKQESFEKLKAINDYKGLYRSYYWQAQAYMGCSPFIDLHTGLRRTAEFCRRVFFCYYNRNTGEILGGIEVDSPHYTQREDLCESKDEDAFLSIVARLEVAAEYVVKKELPPSCDKDGYCFFCKQHNTQHTKTLQGNKHKQLANWVQEYRTNKKRQGYLAKKIIAKLDKEGHEVIRLNYPDKRGLIIRRWDYL